MKVSNIKIIFIILISITFIGLHSCDLINKDENDNPNDNNNTDSTSISLIDGIYNQKNENYLYIKIVNSASTIEYYTVSDEPNTHCDYENRGKLTPNPSTGFEISEDWYKFNPLDDWCGSAFWVVHQNDSNSVSVRKDEENHEKAYDLGKTIIFEKTDAVNDTSDGQNATSSELIDGTYYEEGEDFIHIKLVNSAAIIELYVIEDEPKSHCDWENRGKLTSNPSTGFEISEDWYKFNPLDDWCGSAFWVVHQEDENTILTRHSSENYEDAYNLGKTRTYSKE